MRRDKRYATRSVQPAQSGPTTLSCTPPQTKTPPVQPDRGNKTPLPKPLLHGVNGESSGTDQSDDSLKTFRSKLRKNTSGNVDQLRQSTRLRKFDNGKVQENGNIEDHMLYAQPQSYIGCEGDGHGKRKQSVDLQSETTMIKMESMEDTANFLPDKQICPKKVLLAAGESDYANNGNLSSSRQKKINTVGWQDHLCQVGSNGHLSSSGDGQVMSSGIIGSVGACTETICSNYSARNVQCQEEITVSKTGVTDISVCKRNRPLSHVNQSDNSKPREKRGTVKTEKVPCLSSPLSHDTGSGLHDEQTENCIVVKMEVPNEQHYAYERNSPRQSSLPLRNHMSSYKFHSLRIDRCSPGPTSCDLSSSKLDQINQGACSQQQSLENSVTLDENFRGPVAHNEHPDMYTLENRKSRTFQKISRKSMSLKTEYRENKVTKSSPTEEVYQSSSSSSSNPPPSSTSPPPLIIPPPPSFPSSIQSQNSKLFSSEASVFHPEASCVKLSLQYEQPSVINQRHQVLPPRKIQGRLSWPLNSSSLREEVGRNCGQPVNLTEGPSPPVFKNVSEALHRLPESPKVPLVCMKDVIVIDSPPGSETSIAFSQSSSPELSSTAKSLLHPRRANTSSKSKTAQRLCFGHEKESTPSACKTKNLKDKPVSLDKSLGVDTKKDNYNKAVSSKATGNSLTSRAVEKVFPVNNSDLILSRTDRIRSPSIRYKDDVLFFPLVFPSRSSQSATNRVSEAVETKSNNRQFQAELDEKVIPKKENVLENVKTVEKINCQSKNNTDSVSAASSKQTESLDRRRILRGSSEKSENALVTQAAAAAASSESLALTLHSTNMELKILSRSKMLLTSCPSAPSSDSSLLPPKSNKVLRSQLSSLKTLASHSLPPLSPSPKPLSPSASLSLQNSEQKCSTGGKPSPTEPANFTEELKADKNGPSTNTSEPKITTPDAKATITNQVDRTQEMKIKIKQNEPNRSHPTRTSSVDPEDRTQGLETKIKPNITNTNQPKVSTAKATIIDQSERIQEAKMKQEHNTNTIQPKVATSNAKGTITDVVYKSASLADPSPIKKVPKTVSKIQSCLRSHSSMSTVIKEPKPLSILSRPERALSESKKLNAFVSDELDKYLAQEIGKYAISPRKIGASTSDSLPSSKKTSLRENRTVVSKKLSFSSKKNSCDKNLITCRNEQSSCNRAEKTMTAVAYNTRSNSSCMSPEKDDKQNANSSNSSDMTQLSSKSDFNAASSEKQTCILSKTELLPTPTSAPSEISEKQMCTRSGTASLPTETPTPASPKIIEKPTHTRSEKWPFSTPTSSKISEKQTYTLSETEPVPTPTETSSNCQNTRILRPRSEQLTARINKPGSSYSNCSVFTSNTQSYEPDFDEVDGILFMSFPNVESLQAHIAVERKSNWESAPSHMSSISKVLNFNRWKERHKTKLPRPAFDKSKNLRGLHMRMKMYYKLLRSEWHKIKQRNQHRSRYGFKKTNDFSKIKSWQTRLNKNLESKRNSKKIHWRTQDQLTCSLKSDEIRQIGIVKKRRKNLIFTRHKSCKLEYPSEDEELENSSIPYEDQDLSGNGRKKQNSPTTYNVTGSVSGSNSDSECSTVVKSAHLLYESEEINLIKKLGGSDPSDYAMRKRTRSQVELENLHRRSKNLPPIALDWLTHNMARVALTALHDDFVKKKSPSAGKNVSNVHSEGKHNTDTFIQVDSKVARVKSNEESSLPSLFESQKSQLPSSRPPSSAVHLCKTSDEDLAKETARILLTRQKLKAKDQKCNKPGCRYGCICHLCWISENFEDSSKTSAICTKTCDKEYCRLGCICDSNDNIKLENICHEQTCTLECCRCSEHENVTPKSGRKKESLKPTPPIASDVIVISPEKLTDDSEPEPFQEVIKCKGTDITDSQNCKTYNTDKEGIKKKSDMCAEKLKRLRRERSSSLPKRESTYRDGRNVVVSSRKPLSNEGSEIFQGKKKRKLNFDANCPKVNFTKVKQLQTKSSSAYAGDEKDNSKTVPHSNSIKRLCPLRDDCRQPLEQCYVNCSWFPANTFDNCVVEIDRLGSPQQMRQLGCMSVDYFPQSTKMRTPQQMQNSSCSNSASSSTNANNSNRHTDCIKCELIDLSPIKVKPSAEVMSLPAVKVADSPSPETKSNSINPPRLLVEVADSEKWSCPLVDLTDVSAEDPSESCHADKDWQVKMICLKAKQDAGPSTQNMEEAYQLLEFISNCNWDSHSSDVICQVSLCCEPGKYPDPQKMAVGNFDVEILPKSDKAPNVPLRLQSEIFCCPYNIRVKVTDRAKGTGSGEKVEPLLEGCSYLGISSVRPIRNNNQLDIKSMSLTATLQDINYQCQEDNEQNEMPNEAKNVVGEIEVLEIHPPLDEKIPERALVLDLSPENQKPVSPEQVKIVTGLSTCDLSSTKPCKQTSNSSEEIGSQPSSENLTATGTDLALKSKKSLTEEETKLKNTADTSSNVRVCRQRSREKTAVVVRDWPLRSKLGKAIKQELQSVTDPSVRKNLTKSMKNCDAQVEYRNMVTQEPCENIKKDAKNISVDITPKLMKTRNDIRKNKSSNCDSPQQLSNDSTESITDLSPNCSMRNLKPSQDELCEVKAPSEKTAIAQSFRKILPARSLNGGFFVTSTQSGVGPICFGHLQGCSLVRADLNNFNSVPHNHTACSTFPNAYTLGSVPTNQFLQLVPVPVPVSFSVAPDRSAVNTNATIPVINSNSRTSPYNTSPSSSSHAAMTDKTCCSHSVTTGTTCCSSHSVSSGTTCGSSHSVTTGTTCCSSHSMTTGMTYCSSHSMTTGTTCCHSHSVATGTTCCNSCCSTLPVTHKMNNSCISVTNSNSCCNMESGNNTKNLVNEPSLPLPVPQPGHILVSQGQNNAILVPYKTFIKKNTNIDSQEHCTDKCLVTDKSTPKNYVDLKEVKVVPNNELFNCQDNQQQLSPNDDTVCDVPSQNFKQEETEKKLCAKESQVKKELASMKVEPVNCLSSLQSGLNLDFRQDPIDENDFDDEDWVDFDDFDQSEKDRRNRYQLSVHKTRERERRCNIFNGINILQEVLCKNEHIQFISQRKILDFATDHIKSLQITEEEMTGEKTSLGKINHQLWEQLNKVKDKLKLQNITECEQNKILDESGLPFDMYMPPTRDGTKLEDDAGSPLKFLPALDSYEASDVELKDHSDIEFELDVRLVSSSLHPRSPSPLSGPLNEVHSSNEDTILMSPVTSQQMQDLDDDVEKVEHESSCFNSSNPE